MAIVEIVTIGREILDGRVVDTNSVAIAEALKPLGLTCRFAQRVDDEITRIVDAFKIAEQRSEIILVTGGLGPTSDDLTAEAFGRYLGEELVLNAEALNHVETIFKMMNRPMLEVQKKQAKLPPSCFVLTNNEGTAPGFGLSRAGRHWFFMPGVPREMKRMLKDEILPRIKQAGLATANARLFTWATQFTSEGKLQEQLTPVERALPQGFEVTYRTRFPENHIGLAGICDTPEQTKAFNEAREKIDAILSREVFSRAADLDPLPSLEGVVVDALKRKGIFLATVESCTGGLVAHRVTSVAGSSEVFWGSHVCYDNSAKELLGVSKDLLAAHGAVSKEVAMALADAGLKRLLAARPDKAGKAICVSTTGIAGPGGGSKEKPVGLCYLGLAVAGRETVYEELRGRIGLDREQNKMLFSQKALDLIRLWETQ